MQIRLYFHIHTLCQQNNYDFEERICYIQGRKFHLRVGGGGGGGGQ